VGFSEEFCDNLSEKMPQWVDDFLVWIDSKKKRKIKIHIDNYDSWNADQTLALIILPLLKEVKKDKCSSPVVDIEDVPTDLAPPKEWVPENEWDTCDPNYHKRWEYVLDQMIWSFEHILDDDDTSQFFVDGNYDSAGMKAYIEKTQVGLTLFGKYYRGLWT
jgi:hypothetical protein